MRQPHPPARPATFEALYAEHAARVVSLLRWLRVRELSDVAQEVWLAVHQGLAAYDAGQGTERAWILGITRNAARDWHRKRRRQPELSPLTGHELAEPPTSEAEAAREQQREALWAYFARAVPNPDQREAYVLHQVGGLTVEEVAKQTGERFWTAQWRLKMARNKLKEAQETLTDEERKKLRALAAPVVSLEALLEAMREPVSDRELAHVWDRVSEQITREGGSIHDRLGPPAAAHPPAARRPRHPLTGAQIAAGLAGAFAAGVLTGAAALHTLTSRDHAREPSIAMLAEPRPPPPAAPPQPAPEPTPLAGATPGATPATPRSPVLAEAAEAAEASEALLDRARSALHTSPRQALALTREHASAFEHSKPAEREHIAIRALVQLGQRAEAEARAADLVRWAPAKRPALESLLGRSFL